jgi:hypothetical protein
LAFQNSRVAVFAVERYWRNCLAMSDLRGKLLSNPRGEDNAIECLVGFTE